MAEYRHLYGPVPSRRLGRSLGVDMVPMKTCCFDCIYCQLGPTSVHTAERAAYVEIDEVLSELQSWLDGGGAADYLTFAGSGEPMLNINLGEAMARTRQMTDIPICLLTNGALLYRPGPRDAAMQADLIVPSLDAGTEEVFQQINRPVRGITLERVVEGLEETVATFHGEVWLEVMLVEGVNDSDAELEAIARHIERIDPARVQINTVVRPAPGGNASRVSNAALVRARVIFGPRATVISSAWDRGVAEAAAGDEQEVLALITHRPATLQDVAHGLGMHPNEAIKHITHLLSEETIRAEERNGETFYLRAD